ncbi:oligoendopeptidase F [Borrelia miyamotoi]|uniref:Oligopeptidase F n=1 Tax=Borrelia miyamotoi TaxID=47466 RepID=A0AAQ2WX67_9SPIR|nr:oligoendopeptidase F [Borrelia miyamotoi]AGT27243.1 oligoendopeptidase F [Borrelia miyamotoi LB-2001]AJA58428.1 oligoendopeptidase F [Borrelia miyamotoi]AOW95506.1 oligoendopeptidase F [Borrelia miyamotoi]QTL83390.1 oligoendopeptidase F [Borrelia miyamotoi]WAZ85313.1 oligoendopeptidase F [Borrelia miyamotoi]
MIDRIKINEDDKWDLSSLFKNDEEYKETVKKIKFKLQDFKKYEKLEFNLNIFKQALNDYYAIEEELEKTTYYTHIKLATDVTNQISNKLRAINVNLETYTLNVTSFFIPKILKIDTKQIREWLEDIEIKNQKIAIEKILRHKEHILNEGEEKILANYTSLYSSYEDTFSSLTNADMEFGEIDGQPLSNATYNLFLQNENQEIRREAFLKFYQEYKKHENTLANLLIANINKNKFLAKTRKFENTISMKLFQNNIDYKVYTNLIETVNENLSVLHEYYEFRKNILKQEYLNHYDVYVPLTKDIKFKSSFKEACDKILKSLEILGSEYTEVLRKGLLKERWVDKYENKGKIAGAFSASSYNGKPYILMNYKDESIRDMFTLAHEAGHSMHSYFSIKNNPFPQYKYSIFEAEIASTLNEQILAEYLLKNENDIEKIKYIKLNQIDDLLATFFRQTMFAEFEYIIHGMSNKDEPVVKETLKTIYLKLLKKYFGPSLKFNENSSLECLKIPHFYSPFYVYQYATGITAALLIHKNIKENKKDATKNYIEFLKIGGSKYPLESLKITGVDLSLKKTIKNTINIFKERLEDVRQLF